MQLLFPSFLFGLVASIIPIIIHLLQLRRPQRVRFTNTDFIKQLELTVARQRRIKQWLVLLMRVLALVFLVLAFCQPFVPTRNEGVPTSNNQVDVLVDASPSMQVASEATGETLLQDAVNEAQGLGKAYGAQGRFGLLQPKRSALTSAAYQAQLQEIAISDRAVSLQKLLVASSTANGGAIGPLYIISDFQRDEVSPALFTALASRQEAVLLPVAGKRVGNVYVDSVWVDDAFVRVRTNVGLHVRLRNGGQVAATDCPVKVFLGQLQVAAFRVSIAAGQAAVSVVQVQVADKALARGRVVTEDAPVTFDNTYYFTLRPADQIRVVELGAEPVAQRLYTNEPIFNYTFNSFGTVDYGLLRTANLVLIREVPQPTVGLRQALREVVKRGGSVVVVPPGDKQSQAAYQQLFRELGVGNPQWEANATPELREVAMPSGQEPFFQDVFGAQQRQVTMPRAAPVLRWGRTEEDILKFRDGESYLASFRVGAGRVYVFAAPFAARYSDFTNHALFVPVLYRLAMLSYRNDQLPAYRLTQPALTLTVPVAGGRETEGASYRLVKDSLTLIPGQRLQGQELRLELPADLTGSGFYEVRRRGQLLTTLAFNQDRRESELATYSAAELRQLAGANHPNVRVLEGGVGTAVARYRAAQTSQPLWRYCVAAALACLLAEVFLLRRRAPLRSAVAA